MSEEKKVTGIDAIESGFIEEPVLTAAEQIQADSFVVSEQELESKMKEAGIAVPEHQASKPAVSEGAINQEEGFFTAAPELTPIEQLAVDEAVASPAEIEEDMKKAGIAVPEHQVSEPAVPEGAINQEEGFFSATPELTPIEQLAVDETVVSPAEIEDDMKKAGLK